MPYPTYGQLAGLGYLGQDSAQKDIDMKAKADIDKVIAGQRVYSSDLDTYVDYMGNTIPADAASALRAAAVGNTLSAAERAAVKSWAGTYYAQYDIPLSERIGGWLTAATPFLQQAGMLPTGPTSSAADAPASVTDPTAAYEAQMAAAVDAEKKKTKNIIVLSVVGVALLGGVIFMMGK